MASAAGGLRRAGGLAAAALLTALGGFVATALATSSPAPRREERRLGLAQLLREEASRGLALKAELEAAEEQVEQVRSSLSSTETELARLSADLEATRRLFGLGEMVGEGLEVTLDDSPLDTSPTGDPNDLLIHQEDLQAVVNALLAAGAEALAVNGERVGPSSSLTCAGSTLLLNGSLFVPPFRVAALGDPSRLRQALESDPEARAVARRALLYRIVFVARAARELRVPAAPVPKTLRFARPLG
jgi:uncharacterized protein YlxW (UPF0749 family)